VLQKMDFARGKLCRRRISYCTTLHCAQLAGDLFPPDIMQMGFHLRSQIYLWVRLSLGFTESWNEMIEPMPHHNREAKPAVIIKGSKHLSVMLKHSDSNAIHL